MHAVFSGLRLPATNFPGAFKPASAKSIYSNREIADGALLSSSQRFLFQSSVSSIKSEGNRGGRPRRKTASDRPAKENNKLKDPAASDHETSRSSSQEEIIALFRRIQSSLSKDGSAVRNKRSSNSSKDNKFTETFLGALQQYPSRNQVRGSAEEADKALPRRKVPLTKERTGDALLSKDFKISRPVSNFVKRSPIPSPMLPKEKIGEVVEERLPVTIAEEVLELQRIKELKLSELKEFARSKGVKGYSKLKKGELVELLKGLLQSSG